MTATSRKAQSPVTSKLLNPAKRHILNYQAKCEHNLRPSESFSAHGHMAYCIECGALLEYERFMPHQNASNDELDQHPYL